MYVESALASAVYDSGDTAWVLTSTALVMLMLPGLAIFYAGMVRAKNSLSIIMQNFGAMAVVSVTWVVVGYSLAFGPDKGGVIGGLDYIGLDGLNDAAFLDAWPLSIPPLLFMLFQMMFCVITAALITGSAADRMKFGASLVFLATWSILVYPVIAHWAWGGGWMAQWGVLDFAGGTVVEICSGASALALAIVIGHRRGWPKELMLPHNLTLTLLGAGLLWFGWLGFNAGSALTAGADAASAAVATHLSGVGGFLGWLILEKRLVGKPTALGGATGAVAGLVAITPAAGFLDPIPSLILGFVAGAVCLYAIKLKFRFRYDDTLDVVAVHYVGGVVGMLFLGFFARGLFATGGEGLGIFNGGGVEQFGKQLVAVIAASAFAFIVSYLIARAVKSTMGLRVSAEHEEIGLDQTQHGENAYEVRL